MTTMKRRYPNGTALEPGEIARSSDTSDLFVTMCFYARLGFIQPPSCLKCAYRKSNCGRNNEGETTVELTTSSSSSCNNLVPWRKDANIPLHPDGLGKNLVFLTCDTAKSLISGDSYPSLRWDSKKKEMLMLYEM
ncbi:hypothetical protein ACHAWC_009287 [Mediolabrus comicus]